MRRVNTLHPCCIQNASTLDRDHFTLQRPHWPWGQPLSPIEATPPEDIKYPLRPSVRGGRGEDRRERGVRWREPGLVDIAYYYKDEEPNVIHYIGRVDLLRKKKKKETLPLPEVCGWEEGEDPSGPLIVEHPLLNRMGLGLNDPMPAGSLYRLRLVGESNHLVMVDDDGRHGMVISSARDRGQSRAKSAYREFIDELFLT